MVQWRRCSRVYGGERMRDECRRMFRVTRTEASLLSSLERSDLDTTNQFTSNQAIEAITLTGNKQGRSFNFRLNNNKLCRIFRKSDNYEEVNKNRRGEVLWRRVQ